jgi:aldose 1-epimerase
MPDRQPVTLYALSNAHGLQAEITDYGATMTRLLVPDRAGQLADIILGYRTLA